MIASPSVAALAAALNVAQRQIQAPAKNKTVKVASAKGSYSFKYATLDSILEAIREPLSVNGLSFSQGVERVDGQLRLTTLLMHTSGEWLGSWVPMQVQTEGMQALGSAISYARRYGISNALGITADEDDDGNAADGNKMTVVSETSGKPSSFQVEQIKKLVTNDKSGVVYTRVSEFLQGAGVASPAELELSQYKDLRALLNTA